MSFLERLRQQVETTLSEKRQQEDALRAKQQVDESAHRQRVDQEIETRRQRREQAILSRKQSGIDTLLSKLDELILRDPTRNDSRGIVTLAPEISASEPYSIDVIFPKRPSFPLNSTAAHAIGGLRYKGLDYNPEFERDSIFDVIVCGENVHMDGETGEITETRSVEYLVVETNPDGDIVFHSVESGDYGYKRMRDDIPRATWINDKGILENTLGIAFNRPRRSYEYTVDHSGAKPGWTGGFTG